MTRGNHSKGGTYSKTHTTSQRNTPQKTVFENKKPPKFFKPVENKPETPIEDVTALAVCTLIAQMKKG